MVPGEAVIVAVLELSGGRLIDDDHGPRCSWIADAGHDEVSGPSTAAATAGAFASPKASSTSTPASRIVPMPCVRQCVGTSSMLSKNRALSARVAGVSAFRRVREASDEPGSLNPMCPVRPMPRICRSMPPAAAIAASYRSPASASGPSSSPGTRTSDGSSPRGPTMSRSTTAR